MKINNTHMKITLGLMLMTAFAHAQTWQGGTGNWTDDNWNLSPGAYPGDADNINSGATINAGNVTVNSNIPNSIGAIGVKDSVLNIDADISSTTGATLIQGNATVNQTGSFTYTGFQSFQLGYNTQSDNVVWNLTGGSYSNNQRGIDIGRSGNYTNSGDVTVNMSGSSNISVTRDVWFNQENGTLTIDASSGASVEVTGNNYGIRMHSRNTAQQAINYNARLEVSGFNAATTLDAGSVMDVYQGAFADGTDAGTGSSVVAFNLANDPNGVNAWTTETLDLGDGTTNAKGDLEVDVTQLVGEHTIDLFAYDSLLNGEFGDVRINFGATFLTEGTSGSLNQNEYFLDYGSGSNDFITLEYNVIPEPSTLALFAIAGLGMVVGLRRRR